MRNPCWWLLMLRTVQPFWAVAPGPPGTIQPYTSERAELVKRHASSASQGLIHSGTCCRSRPRRVFRPSSASILCKALSTFTALHEKSSRRTI